MYIFVWVRIRSLKNILKDYFHHRNFSFFIIVFSLFVSTLGIYLAVWKGLNFLVSLGGIGSIIINKLFYILFFIIFFMIAISFSLLLYSFSFRSKEIEFLISLPIPYYKISLLKFLEAVIISSWIPLVTLVIFIAGYVKISNLSSLLVVSSIIYLVPFLLISSFLGYLVYVVVLNFFSFKRTVIFALFLLVIFYFISKPNYKNTGDILYMLSDDIIFIKLSRLWFLPFSWVTRGIINLEDGKFLRSFLFLANLVSLTSVGISFILNKGGEIFLKLFYKYSIPKHKGYYYKSNWEKILNNSKLPRWFSNFVIKDIKLFMREPTLWSQFLIFFGLLFFYFINLRRLSYHNLEPIWKNLITFLNTFSILTIVSAFGIRFVFPQWSLEGRNYWIVKLSPVSLKKIYLEKFIFSSIIMSLVSSVLIFISNYMLQLERFTSYLTSSIIIIGSFSIVSFSLGLGAYFADFKVDYYLKAVESWGGFISLVLNFAYVVITAFIFILLTHFFIVREMPLKRVVVIIYYIWVAISILLGLLLTNIGFKKLKEKEY
ncbi:MAG: hypothetical protein NC820_06705 [Candidatus Omnitrophica bacterium]|nr:hypothetical protein [Candidatus Omnitrophota bacterium]